MFYTIYKITNKIDGKYYIGKHQTKDLDDEYFGSGKLVKRAIQKHGRKNFLKEILHVFETEDEMNQKEQELVQIGENSYNLCEGGKGGWSYVNRNYSGLDKKAIQASKIHHLKLKTDSLYRSKYMEKILPHLRNPKHIENTRQKLLGNKNFLGRKHSEKTKNQISLSQQGKHEGSKNSQYGTCWIKHPTLGNKKIDKDDLSMYINKGWSSGRKI